VKTIVGLLVLLATPMIAEAGKKSPDMTVTWEVHIPMAGCHNGAAVPNVDIPIRGGASVSCVGSPPPDTLPTKPARASNDTHEDADYEVGTIIALGISRDQIVLAADSRNTLIKTRNIAGRVERKVEYDDTACKLIQITPTMLFTADGQTKAGGVPANILYDAHELARLAVRNFRSNPEELQLAGGAIVAIATRWAWDVDFRITDGIANGWTPIQSLEGIFAGLEPNGEIGIAVARLNYPTPRPGVRVPSVTFYIGTIKPPPADFTWIEAYGMNDVAQTYYSSRKVNAKTKPEHDRIKKDLLKKPDRFSPRIPEKLVALTIQDYKAKEAETGYLFVHEPIDVAVLKRKKQIRWIHCKPCSGNPSYSKAHRKN